MTFKIVLITFEYITISRVLYITSQKQINITRKENFKLRDLLLQDQFSNSINFPPKKEKAFNYLNRRPFCIQVTIRSILKTEPKFPPERSPRRFCLGNDLSYPPSSSSSLQRKMKLLIRETIRKMSAYLPHSNPFFALTRERGTARSRLFTSGRTRNEICVAKSHKTRHAHVMHSFHLHAGSNVLVRA